MSEPGFYFRTESQGTEWALVADADVELVELGEGVALPERFHVAFRRPYPLDGSFDVEMDVEVVDQRARVTKLVARETDKSGIAGITFDRFSVQHLLEVAARTIGAFASVAPLDTVWVQTSKASRKRVTPTRLQEIADAYNADGIEGIKALGVGERHAWRLKKQAEQAGLIDKKA